MDKTVNLTNFGEATVSMNGEGLGSFDHRLQIAGSRGIIHAVEDVLNRINNNTYLNFRLRDPVHINRVTYHSVTAQVFRSGGPRSELWISWTATPELTPKARERLTTDWLLGRELRNAYGEHFDACKAEVREEFLGCVRNRIKAIRDNCDALEKEFNL